MDEKRPNFRKQPCCGNCVYSFEDYDGAHFCNVAGDRPPAGGFSWRQENIVFCGGVCDCWKLGAENQPTKEAKP